MAIHTNTLIDILFESKEANTLTSAAAERIDVLTEALEALVQESLAITDGELADHTANVLNGAIEVLGE